MRRVDSLEKDFDAGRDWGQEEKGTTEDEMAGWHQWLDGCEFEWTPGVGDGQRCLACCNSWGRKESGTTEQLNLPIQPIGGGLGEDFPVECCIVLGPWFWLVCVIYPPVCSKAWAIRTYYLQELESPWQRDSFIWLWLKANLLQLLSSLAW